MAPFLFVFFYNLWYIYFSRSFMTRINVVPVSELIDKHLRGEYHEITRVPSNLQKSLNRKSKPFSIDEIPSEYVLGTGHVKFFYDKMQFLHKRYVALVDEMNKRGYGAKGELAHIFKVEGYYNDYEPTEKALSLNRTRIEERK